MRLAVPALLLTLAAGPAWGHACEPFGWAQFTDPGPQTYEKVETVTLENGDEIRMFRFGEPAGDYAKIYIFIRFHHDCVLKAVSLGSYAATNAFSAETGGGPVFHLDLYDGEMHATLGMFDAPPPYEEARAEALKALETDPGASGE